VADTLVSLGTTGRVWIGASDQANDGTWVWRDGTPFDFRFFDCSTTANKTGSEDCGNLVASSKCWDDEDCSGKTWHYLCRAAHASACP
jgi:hypothetical protein